MSSPQVVRVEFDYTLMRLVGGNNYVDSGTQDKVWFFEMADVAGDAVWQMLNRVFKLENARLRAREPSDPNYLAPVAHKQEVIEPALTGPFPWEQVGKSWERSTCWAESRSRSEPVPIQPGDFSMLHILRRVQDSKVSREDFMRLATKELFSVPEAEAEKMFADPDQLFKKLGV